MTEIVTGGCQCGQVRYEIRGPFSVYACHCRECQKQSASAFGLSIPIASAAVAISGEMHCYEREADSGARVLCYFCCCCGTRIYHGSSRSPDWMALKGGTLDDVSAMRPVAHIWVSRRQPWLVLDAGAPHYSTQPEDMIQWRASLMGAAT